MFPEPVLRENGVPVAVNDVIHGIDLENDLPLVRKTQIGWVKHDRDRPDPDLQRK